MKPFFNLLSFCHVIVLLIAGSFDQDLMTCTLFLLDFWTTTDFHPESPGIRAAKLQPAQLPNARPSFGQQ